MLLLWCCSPWRTQGCQALLGLVGEFMVIIASFGANFWYAALAAITLIVGAAYSLWLVKRVIFGEINSEQVAELKDVGIREFCILMSLAILVVLLGVWPAPLIEFLQPSVDELLKLSLVTKVY